MTLIVARKFGNQASIVGDSLVSGGNQDLRKPNLALKLLSIDNQTAIAYAGSPEIAHRLIRQATRTHSSDDASDIAARLAPETGCAELDFLIVQCGRVFEIKNGSVKGNLGAAWIGDHPAFTAFQEHATDFARVVGAEHSHLLGLRYAMEQVAQNPRYESVGWPIVSMTSTENDTKYDCMMSLTSPKFVPKASDWFSVDFGEAARGGFGYTTVTPPTSGIAGWGMYYFQAFKGFYFAVDFPNFTFNRYVGSAKSAQHFCEMLEQRLGYRPQYCGQLGIP